MTAAGDYPDWTQPVSQVETVTVLTDPNTLLPPGGAGVTVDTSAAESVLITLAWPGGAADVRYLLQATWSESGASEGAETVSLHSAASYVIAPGTLAWQLPVRGPALSLVLRGGIAAGTLVTVYGSTRALPAETLTTDDTLNGRLLLNVNFGAVAGGGQSAVSYIPPVERAIGIRSNVQLTTELLQFQGLYWDGANVSAADFAYLPGTGAGQFYYVLTCPRMGLELIYSNGDAAAHTRVARVWDVS